jgi:hypothetical protein
MVDEREREREKERMERKKNQFNGSVLNQRRIRKPSVAQTAATERSDCNFGGDKN